MIYKKKKTKAISFPLGGIGSGCIGLSGNGELNDWEIFNRPNKNTRNGYSHFAIKATRAGKSVTRVLHGDTNEDLLGTPCASRHHYGFGFGPRDNSLAGYPHFEDVTFRGEFPIAELTFENRDFPVAVRLHAFNPLIPHDEFHSSLPAAFFEWEIENTTEDTVEIALAGTVQNPAQTSRNESVSADGVGGVLLRNVGVSPDEVGYSDLCILTDHPDTVVQEYWYRGAWMDGCTTYWKNLTASERLPERHYEEPAKRDHATVAAYATLQPGARERIRFVIAWNVPIVENYWKPRAEGATTWRNYYATQFENSLATAQYALRNFEELYEKTARFSDALQSSTLPEAVKDAVSANLSVLKSPTVLRLEDGSFWAWEGCIETVGSCYGSCQHVWNYAYAMPYLFPCLERSLRQNTLTYGLREDGKTTFRLNLPLGEEGFQFHACVDGQMGEVIKCYREWKLSGDNAWLAAHADGIFRMLEYAWSDHNSDRWDADMDGVLEGRQHHTLDMELFGPSSWLEGFYLLALRCGAEMAEHLGDSARAELYTRLYERGSAWMNEYLFNGSYFCQEIDLTDRSLVECFEDAAERYWNDEAKEIKYQVAGGCIIDQMLADWHAALIGMEGVFDPEKKKTALLNLYRNNYKSSMREVTNMWRNFSLNDERGTVICTYPDGVQMPAIPIPYCEETMTGFEYALAGLLIAEGFVSEGERVVEAVRDRYDGERRNPWNEIECGSNYARSMASFALLPIYSGFTFDMPHGQIGFAPIAGEGRFLFSVGESWGVAELRAQDCRLSVCGNPLTLRAISIPRADSIGRVTVDGQPVRFSIQDGTLLFDSAVRITESLVMA